MNGNPYDVFQANLPLSSKKWEEQGPNAISPVAQSLDPGRSVSEATPPTRLVIALGT